MTLCPFRWGKHKYKYKCKQNFMKQINVINIVCAQQFNKSLSLPPIHSLTHSLTLDTHIFYIRASSLLCTFVFSVYAYVINFVHKHHSHSLALLLVVWWLRTSVGYIYTVSCGKTLKDIIINLHCCSAT